MKPTPHVKLPDAPAGCYWGTIKRNPGAEFPVHTTMALLDPGDTQWRIVGAGEGKWGRNPEGFYAELVRHTDTIDRLFLELSQFTRATTSKENRKQEKIRELWQERRSLMWLVHEAANRLETIRDTHPSIDTADLLARLRAVVPVAGLPELEPTPEP